MHLGDHIDKKYDNNPRRGHCYRTFYSTCHDYASSVREEGKCDNHTLLNRASENSNPFDVDII